MQLVGWAPHVLHWLGGVGGGLPRAFVSLLVLLCQEVLNGLSSFQTRQLEPLLSHFTEEEELQMKRMLQRMDVLAKVWGRWGQALLPPMGTHGRQPQQPSVPPSPRRGPQRQA